MKNPRLSLPKPCAWGLLLTLSALPGTSRATILSLPGMGWQLPEAEGGNAAAGAGGAGKDFSSLAKFAQNKAAAEVQAPEPAPETKPEVKNETAPKPRTAKRRVEEPEPKRTKKRRPSEERPAQESVPEPAPVKEAPAPVAVASVDNRPTIFFTTGYSNRLYFRGLDILDRISPDNASGAFTNRIKVTKGGWEFGAQYLSALDTQLPDQDALGIEPNLNDSTGTPNPNASAYEGYRVPSKDRYAELDLWTSYSHYLGNKFTGTIGATYYHFLNKQFWGVQDAFELQAAVSYSGFKYVEPTLLYAYDFNGFKGGYAELTVAGKGIPYRNFLTPETGMKWSATPYAKLAYDFSYNGVDSGWNHAEIGVNVPITLNKHLALNVNGAYVADLGDDSGGRDRADSGWWFGLSLSAATRLGAFPDSGLSDPSGKGKVALTAPPDRKWSFSGGIGGRSINADFDEDSQSFTSALSHVTRKVDRGSVGLADSTADKVYEDGTVHSNTQPGTIAGTSKFTGGQVTGTREDRDQQVRFLASQYYYSNILDRYERNVTDEDRALYPYFRLDRELANYGNGTLSLGLMYSFTASELDSGTGLSALDRANELFQQHHYLYDVNELDDVNARTPGAATIIFNDEAMAGDPFFAGNPGAQEFYGTRDPQQAIIEVITEVNKTATFIHSDLDVSLHSLSAPLSWEWDLGQRTHLSLSAGPVVNVINAELTTRAWSRDLENLAGGRVVSNTTGELLIRTGAPYSTDFVEGNQTAPKTGGTSSGVPGSANTPSNSSSFGAGSVGAVRPASPATVIIPGVTDPNPGTPGTGGGGKGGSALSPRLPGIDRGSRSWNNSDTDFSIGAFAQASLKYDLDQKDRWYIEIWGRYDYIKPVTIGNGAGSAEIDASSWGIGGGVGLRF